MTENNRKWRSRFRDPGVRDEIGWDSGITFLAGIWLIISAFLFGGFASGTGGAWNSLVVGIIIALLAAWRSSGAFDAPELSWINAALGAWMIASPWVYGYVQNEGRVWNSVIVGFIVVVFASASATARPVSSRETYTTESPYRGLREYGSWPYAFPYSYGPFGLGMWGPYERGWRREDVGEYRGRGPRGWKRTDEQIRNAVAERMADDGHIDASDIEVTVENAEVILRGSTPTRAMKRLAEDIAESVGGVRDVRNELRVAENANAPTAFPRRAA